MTDRFSIKESLWFGWEKLRAHSRLLLSAMLALFAIEVTSSVIEKVLGNELEGILASIALAFVSFVISTGFTLIALKLARGEEARLGDLLPPGELLWRYLLVSILVGVIVVAGIILLIIPGIYFAVRLSMANYLVLEGSGVREALHKSGKMTDGSKWHLLGFFVVLILVNIVGALLLGVGLLVSVPVTAVAFAHVYLKLKNRHHAH